MYKFDRELFCKNVQQIAKGKNIMMKKIEEDAGVAPGYISRLRKEGSTTVPSIEFVTNVSVTLGISLAVLLSVDLSKASSREIYLAEFFDKLIIKSAKREIQWQPVNYDFSGEIPAEPEFLEDLHPLAATTDPRQHSDYGNTYTCNIYYASQFCEYSLAEVMADSYQFAMPKGATLYLMKVHYNDVGGEYGPVGNGYEVYIVDSNKEVTAIAHSMIGATDIASKRMENLHQLADEYCKVEELDSSVRGIIDAFMGE